MRLVLLLLILTASCVQKVERKEEVGKPPVYYAPAKGSVEPRERGFFIRTGCGKFVRAVESGRVIYSDRSVESYGWIVIVSQRDGLVSVYGNMSEAWVGTGEGVKRRQVLGKVGGRKGICGVYYELRNERGNTLRPVLR